MTSRHCFAATVTLVLFHKLFWLERAYNSIMMDSPISGESVEGSIMLSRRAGYYNWGSSKKFRPQISRGSHMIWCTKCNVFILKILLLRIEFMIANGPNIHCHIWSLAMKWNPSYNWQLPEAEQLSLLLFADSSIKTSAHGLYNTKLVEELCGSIALTISGTITCNVVTGRVMKVLSFC